MNNALGYFNCMPECFFLSFFFFILLGKYFHLSGAKHTRSRSPAFVHSGLLYTLDEDSL